MSLFNKIKENLINRFKCNDEDKNQEVTRQEDILTADQKQEQVLLIYDLIKSELNKYEADYKFLILNNPSMLEEKKKEIETKIISLIDENEEVLNVVDLQNENIGIIACDFGLEEVVIRALDNETASMHLDNYGYSLGMWAAKRHMERATLKALDSDALSTQECDFYTNIGMVAAEEKMEAATLKALDNYEASTQQDGLGLNIGMIAAQNGLEKAVLKALDNHEARNQIDDSFSSIKDYCFENGLTEAYKKASELYKLDIESDNNQDVSEKDQ